MSARSMNGAIILILLLTSIVLLLGGCAAYRYWPGAPMSQDTAGMTGRHKTLVVFLPGIEDSAQDFRKHGFHEALRRHGVEADTVAVNSHVGYFLSGRIVDQLHEDVILPARAQGYSDIWLVGVSLGGLGSLLYAKEHPEEIRGIVLLAPFLGRRNAIARLVSEGSPKHQDSWMDFMPEGFEPELWAWLEENARNPSAPPIFMGYGSLDKLVYGHLALQRLLPAERVLAIPGDHSWPTWTRLWDGLLERGVLGKGAMATRS
ncbi:MAG: alpha/beta fold hydrolase [Pseudomonadota bacterium]|jgi:pimeloyl-ACP methyl ester carboxylesterase